MRKIKKTKWFPIHTKPARSGLYECDCGLLHYYSQSTKEWYADILDFRLGHKLYVEDWRMWRGLTEKVDDRGTAGKLPNVKASGPEGGLPPKGRARP